jgi:hypothetical protein
MFMTQTFDPVLFDVVSSWAFYAWFFIVHSAVSRGHRLCLQTSGNPVSVRVSLKSGVR